MSVINQMLRDLDKRQGRPQAGMPTPPVKQSPAWHSVLMRLLPMVGLILIGLYLVYQSLQKTTPTVQQPQPSVATVTHTEKEPPSQPHESEDLSASLPTGKQAKTSPMAIETETATTTTTGAEAPTASSETQSPESNLQPAEEIQELPPVQESVPHMIKETPAQTRRDQAESHYQQLMAEHGKVLTPDQLAQVLDLDPEYHVIRIQRLTKLSQIQPAAFEQEVMTAIGRWPAVFQYRQMLARSLVTAQPARAYQLLMDNLPTLESAPDYHGLIAYSAQQMGDYNLASRQYQLLLKNWPERGDWWFALALVEEQLGRTSPALEAYQQSLRFPGLATNVRGYAEQRVRALQGF